jgi:hypothetical protein
VVVTVVTVTVDNKANCSAFCCERLHHPVHRFVRLFPKSIGFRVCF